MSQALTPSIVETIPRPAGPPPVPVNDRFVIRGATWDLYDRLSDSVSPPTSIRMAYDGKDIEIMVVGPRHEGSKGLLSQFLDLVVDGLDIDCLSLGSTTWKREAIERGVESDQCYVFDPAKLKTCRAALRRKSNNVADYPNPDLAIEIDISTPLIDRPGIYAALKVPELWRFNEDGSMSIEQLDDDGKYVPLESSQFLFVRPDEVEHWLDGGSATERPEWRRRVREWVEAELKPRIEARP